jgi:DNA adenine methylase
LSNVVERLRGIRIEKRDARQLLKDCMKRPATLVYLDPPYLADRTNGYTKDIVDKEFHRELLRIANKARCMIFISGYENELYDAMLTPAKGWSTRKIKTTTRDASGHSHKRIEVVWMNKHFTNAQKSKRIPIELTKKEKKLNKINPER